MCDLVDGDDLLVVGEHHHSKYKIGHCLHSVHATTSEQDIVVKWGINHFNVDEDGFSLKFDGVILEEPFKGRGSTIIIL
jgi:hypothetical protein